MSAAATDRRHVRSVETVIETRLVLEEARRLDEREDAARRRMTGHVRGLTAALREETEWDRLGNAQRERAIALCIELAGVLDGVEQIPLFHDAAKADAS